VDGICENINDGGGCGGLGLDRVLVGTFLALYIIVYGQMQAAVPWLVLQPLKQAPPNKYAEILWGFVNLVPTLILWCIALWAPWFIENIWRDKLITMITGIAFFAIIFAINSSIHRQEFFSRSHAHLHAHSTLFRMRIITRKVTFFSKSSSISDAGSLVVCLPLKHTQSQTSLMEHTLHSIGLNARAFHLLFCSDTRIPTPTWEFPHPLQLSRSSVCGG